MGLVFRAGVWLGLSGQWLGLLGLEFRSGIGDKG